MEAGVKINFPSGLSGTASFFDITRSNVTTPDRFNPGFQVATGEIQSQGAEVELAYQVTEQWYVQGGYAFIDAEITQSNANDVGNRPEKIPEHQANIWTHYRFDSGILKNLTLSAGANYVGNRPFDNANIAKLPNYTTLDLATSYLEEHKTGTVREQCAGQALFRLGRFWPGRVPRRSEDHFRPGIVEVLTA